MYRLILTADFDKELKEFVSDRPDDKEKIAKAFKEILTDPDHPSLRTHKLADQSTWSVSIDLSTRITFTLEGDDITLLHIGSHDQVYT